MFEPKIIAAVGAIGGWFGAGLSWFLSHGAPIFSIIAALFAAWASWQAGNLARESRRKTRIELERLQLSQCQQCQSGQPPLHCPFPDDQRPKTCPRSNENLPSLPV